MSTAHDSDQHQFVIVIGHESSGTRLVADTIVKATGYEYDDGENKADSEGRLLSSFLTGTVHGWWMRPETIVYDRPRITRRSLPHGGVDQRELDMRLPDRATGRAFPDPIPFIAGLERAGYDVRVVLTVRDRQVATLSKCREHTQGDGALAGAEMDEALATMRAVLRRHAKCFVCSYEALMALGDAYVEQIYAFLGISSSYRPELRDGNPKYLRKPARRGSPLGGRSVFDLQVGIVTRPDEYQWGGDLRALRSAQQGLELLGVPVRMGRTAEELLDCDLVFLSNTCMDQRPNARALTDRGIPYGLFGFHEDFLAYYPQSMGFTEFISMCLQNREDNGVQLSIDDLWENPLASNYYNHEAPKNTMYNVPVLRAATVCVAGSHREARTMLRDCPACRTSVVYWNIPLLSGSDEYSDEFLQLTGLKRGEYILQVGRLETRKNQLATVLAARELDVPVVLVATKGYQNWYDLLVVNAGAKHRKAPTILVSEEHPTQVIGGAMRIIQMPGGRRLSERCLVSAYQNCGLHVHPAFWEAPGYTYLEAAKVGAPTVASEWGTIQDYCEFGGGEPSMGGRITYVCPYDLPQIEAAIRANFGRRIDPGYAHPIFDRSERDVGKDLLHSIVEHAL